MPQYQDIIASVNIEVRPEDRRYIDNYYKRAMFIKAVDLCFMIVMAVVSALGQWRSGVFFFMAFLVALLLVYRQNKRSAFAKITDALLKDCDPERMLSCLMALLSHSRKSKSLRESSRWGIHFYNISTGLYYAGRFEEAERILALFPKYCPDNESRFKYELLCARLAYQRKDEAALSEHCRNLNGWAKVVKTQKVLLALYQEAMQYPVLLWMENKGAYGQAYEELKKKDTSADKDMLSRVRMQYLLCKMAEGMGDKQAAAVHREFVLRNGGSLWYRKELQKLTETF